MSAPTIFIDGDTLNITDTSGVAERFEVYANGYLITTLAGETTLDLTTLNLEAGDYTITVVARASGYKPSVVSNSSTYIIVEKTEIIEVGTYVFNSSIIVSKDVVYELQNTDAILGNYYNGTNVISQGTHHISFYVKSLSGNNSAYINSVEGYIIYCAGDDWHYIHAYDSDIYGIVPEENLLECRTIEITTDIEVSGYFYDAFTANTNKQIQFTIVDVGTFYALEVMTWSEWCDSEYNTIGLTYDDQYILDGNGNALIYYTSGIPEIDPYIPPFIRVQAERRYELYPLDY